MLAFGRGIGPLLGLGLVVSPTMALAGAWTLDAGTGQALVTGTFSRADQAFDGNGNVLRTPRYDKFELQGWFEYGVTDRFTAIVAPQMQHVDIAPPFEASRTGLGYTELGGRYLLFSGTSWVFSAQTTVRIPGTFDKANPAAIGYTDPEIDMRALFGYSFQIGGWPAFFNLELAQRFRTGDPPDEFRADVTLGLRPAERWLILAQSFNVISEGGGQGVFSPSYSYYKLQLSVAYELTKRWAVQAGAYTTVAGTNALQENALLLGVWYKF